MARQYFQKDRTRINGCLLPFIAIGAIAIVTLLVNLVYSDENSLIELAREEASIPAYERYLEKFPEGEYAEEAESFIVKYFEKLPLLETDPADQTRRYSNFDRLEETRDLFEGKPLGEKMKEVIAKRVEQEYEKALSTGTSEGWRLYKETFPEQYWKDADEWIAKLGEKEGAEQSEKAPRDLHDLFEKATRDKR